VGQGPSKAGAAALVGTTLSERYYVEDILAVGGMAVVYRGEHMHMRKLVAIKVLRPSTDGFGELAARFEHEAIVGAHVDHPNIASATDFGWLPDGSAFLVLEYVEGETLRELIRSGPIAPARVVAIARQLASALSACHAAGVLHRDIKPRNIMVDATRNDLVKLIDFGLARVVVERLSRHESTAPRHTLRPPPPRGPGRDTDADPTFDENDEAPTHRSITTKGIVFGTVQYMAPEIAQGMDAVDERSDLYSLGVVLYEMLCGALPFEARQPADILLQQRTVPPVPLRQRIPEAGISPALEAVVQRLLAPRPADRFQTVDELARALELLARSPAVVATAEPSSPDGMARITGSTLRVMPPVLKDDDLTIARPSWRRRALAALAVAVIIALGFVGIDRNVQQNGDTEVLQVAVSPGAAAEVGERATRAADQARKEHERRRREVVALTARIKEAHGSRSWEDVAEAVIELVAVDPSALGKESLARAIHSSLVQLEARRRDSADKLFVALAERGGPSGLDLLYGLLSSRGGTSAAKRAEEILSRPEVRKRASPPLAIALELRQTRCKDKPSLFERAAREGDRRALLYLDRLQSMRCTPSIGECCFHNHRGLSRSITALRDRLAR
jgi:serine/threonine-protein kinase